MHAMAVPVLEGKVDQWKAFAEALNNGKKSEFADFNKRYGLTHHAAVLQHNPDGSYVVVAIQDGPGAAEFMPSLVKSEIAFDTWFRGKIAEIHGFDPGASPPVPSPENRIDWRE